MFWVLSPGSPSTNWRLADLSSCITAQKPMRRGAQDRALPPLT